MTRDEIIAWAERRYGSHWNARLARELGYSASTLYRFATGEIAVVSPRLELAMRALVRRE